MLISNATVRVTSSIDSDFLSTRFFSVSDCVIMARATLDQVRNTISINIRVVLQNMQLKCNAGLQICAQDNDGTSILQFNAVQTAFVLNY